MVARRVSGDPLKGIDASQPDLQVGCAIFQFGPELADCLGETIGDLRLLGYAQVAPGEVATDRQYNRADGLHDSCPDLGQVVSLELKDFSLRATRVSPMGNASAWRISGSVCAN
jgi:hypothetical protein